MEYFLRRFSKVLDIFCDRLPHNTMPRFCSDTLVNYILLMLLLERTNELRINARQGSKHTEVPCSYSNFSHHAHESPRSESAATALPNHCLAFSIFLSAHVVLEGSHIGGRTPILPCQLPMSSPLPHRVRSG